MVKCYRFGRLYGDTASSPDDAGPTLYSSIGLYCSTFIIRLFHLPEQIQNTNVPADSNRWKFETASGFQNIFS